MPIADINHYFVRANDLEATKDFYVDVLGFEIMPRPNFPFPGYWLGVEGKIQVHMGPHGIDNAELYYLGTPPNAATDQSGVVDHIAFLAKKPEEVRRRIQKHKVTMHYRSFPDAKLFQIFLKDPDEVTIELNFLGVVIDPKSWAGKGAASAVALENGKVRRRN